MDANPSSLELAARLSPQRASRSGSRGQFAVSVIPAAVSVALTTTTTGVPPTTAVVVQKAAAAPTSATTRTTVRHRTTSTTHKPKPATTTTAKPAPKTTSSPPKLREYHPPAAAESTGQSEIGQATWYQTSDPIVCAHKTLPMGTIITVTNTENGKATTCKVGDRGPYVEGRIVDLSPEAFNAIASLSEGVIDVKLTW